MGRQVLYEGTIRGLVMGEPEVCFTYSPYSSTTTVYFTIKLEENIGIKEIPEEILVCSPKFGYFRMGDKVILKGKIVKEDLKQWGKPDYLIQADHYYNETLQSGS